MSCRRQSASFVRTRYFDHPSTITAGRYSRFTVLPTFIRELLWDRSHSVGTPGWTLVSQSLVSRNRGCVRSRVDFVRIDRRRCRLVPTSARTCGRRDIGARCTHPPGDLSPRPGQAPRSAGAGILIAERPSASWFHGLHHAPDAKMPRKREIMLERALLSNTLRLTEWEKSWIVEHS
jgi:hypothetical protein